MPWSWRVIGHLAAVGDGPVGCSHRASPRMMACGNDRQTPDATQAKIAPSRRSWPAQGWKRLDQGTYVNRVPRTIELPTGVTGEILLPGVSPRSVAGSVLFPHLLKRLKLLVSEAGLLEDRLASRIASGLEFHTVLGSDISEFLQDLDARSRIACRQRLYPFSLPRVMLC